LRNFFKIKDIKAFDVMNLNVLSSEVGSIIVFRNSVVHNKISIGQTFKGKSLVQMIDIYLKF
jgi:hypothetical protein